MARRRMFSTDVVTQDAFLDMPSECQLLYFHLGMNADDEGFVSPKKVMRMVGSNDDSLKLLIGKGFLIPFESGVTVITHWKLNNYLRNDRFTPSAYQRESAALTAQGRVYQLAGSVVYQRYTEPKALGIPRERGREEERERVQEPGKEERGERVSEIGMQLKQRVGLAKPDLPTISMD